jgi:hypothetical protein
LRIRDHAVLAASVDSTVATRVLINSLSRIRSPSGVGER